MQSVLHSETLRLLREYRPRKEPLFSNAISAELFEASHTLGRFKVLPRVDGWWVVFEAGRKLGEGTRGAYTSAGAALVAIEGLVAAEAAAGRQDVAA